MDRPPGLTLTVKLPCTPDGLEAAALLVREVPRPSITITGVYSAAQVLAAQAAGADYMAPYLGRMVDSMGPDKAFDAVISMQRAVRASASSMRILVASIRSADVMAALAAEGCDTFTFSPAVMQQLCCNSTTLAAAAAFEEAAARNSG